MAKNFKGKAQRPPLSVLDKVIYWLLILLLLYAATFGSTYLGTGIARRNAFADPSVVAGDGDMGLFYSLPLCIFSMVLAVLVYTYGLKKRQPILGNNSYQTPVFAHTIKTYPLFSQDFRDQLRPESWQRLKRILLLLTTILLVCLLLLPFGFYSRRVLTDNHQLITYDSFNRISDSHHIREADRALITVALSGGRRYSHSYKLQLQFVFEDTTYFLDIKDFRNMSREEALRYMISLKDVLGPGEYEIHNSERLEWLIMDKNYSPAEAKLLYQLFDLPA